MTAIDTRYPVETPDGIELSLLPAGPVMRGLAWLIDLMIRAGFMFVLAFLLAWFDAIGVALMIIAWFMVNWWYPVLFEVLAHGATPGKKAVGLKVLNEDGTPVGWGASIIRNLLRQVDFLPALYSTGLISMLCNRRFQRLGDLAAGTLVVYQDMNEAGLADLPAGAAKLPPVSLSTSEQQTLVSFGERARRLNPQRTAELADLVAPLTGVRGQPGVELLLGWARWIRGQQP
ncbi:MAG: RDD family protein [Wenzhouxiangella sp.]